MKFRKPSYGRLEATLIQLQSEFSVVHEILSRIVVQERTITFDADTLVPDGQLKWDSAVTESGSKQTTIWFVPKEEGETNEEISN